MLPLLALLAAAAAEPAQTVHRFTRSFTSVYAIVGESGVVLVDAHYPGSEEWITRKLEKQGIALSDVTLLVLTHGHGDHAGSAAALQAAGIPVAIGEGDAASVASGDHGEPTPTDWRGALIALTLDGEFPSLTPDVVLTGPTDLSEYGVEATVELVGGHSPGSLVVVLPDGRVATGDLIRGHFIRRRAPALHFFHLDEDLAHSALTELLDAGMTEALTAHSHPVKASRLRRWLKRFG